jgi:hypothetical protein
MNRRVTAVTLEAHDAATGVTCTACGYDLRTLASSGACPECGQAVATSVHDHSIVRPRWLRSVSVGSLLIGIGLLVGGAGLLFSFWPPLAAILWRRGLDQRTALWLLPLGAVMSGAGTWRFAAPTPRVARMHGRSLATILRVVAVITCTLQLQLFLYMAAGFRGMMPLHPAMLALSARALLVAWSAAALMTCIRAAYVAGEIHDRPGIVQAWALALLAPMMLLYFAASANLVAIGQVSRAVLIAWAIGACVIAGWSAVFFGGFAIIVRRRATILRPA